jgi:hypothetical protein
MQATVHTNTRSSTAARVPWETGGMSRYYYDRTAIVVEQAEEPVHRRGVLRLLTASKALSHTALSLRRAAKLFAPIASAAKTARSSAAPSGDR